MNLKFIRPCVVTIIVVANFFALQIGATSISFNNPIRTAQEDEIKHLPGLNHSIKFKQFSGYLQADNRSAKPKNFLHYWFVESQLEPAEAPILLWLNGGPGCSSLVGLFTEIGPFKVAEGGDTLIENQHSWNQVANVLFLDSPVGTGFSYSRQPNKTIDDDTTAKGNYFALKSFMRKFPQYVKNSLYLSGESYAGVYLPTLGLLVDQDPALNLKGIAIGNGFFDEHKQTSSMIFFQYYHGLIGASQWNRISEACCRGLSPTREYCNFKAAGCSDTVYDIQYSLSAINPYNIHNECADNGSWAAGNLRDKIEPVPLTGDKISQQVTNSADYNVRELSDGTPCIDDSNMIKYLSKYLNKKKVRKAVHVPQKLDSWTACSDDVFNRYHKKYPLMPGGLTKQMDGLIGSQRNLTMLVYNGDLDTVCNFLGVRWFVECLGRKSTSEYLPWKLKGQVAGFVQLFDGITFATVLGAGHSVPADRPSEARSMIKLFLEAESNGNIFMDSN